MTQFIELTGRTEADAITQALAQLGLERDDIRVEVLERAKTGFLGFGSKPAKIRVSYEEKIEPVNLYADIKAEESQEKTLEATQSINTEQLATMLDQSSLTTVATMEEMASSHVVSGSAFQEESTVNPEKSPESLEKPVETQGNLEEWKESAINSLETKENTEESKESATNSVENQENTEESIKSPENPVETPENVEDSPETPASPVKTQESRDESQNSQENTAESQNSTENTQESEEKPKKLSKKERENLTTEEQEALTKEIERFLSGLMVHLQVTATPSVTYQGLTVKVRLDGEGLATLIGKRGETLDSIQQITGYVVMRTCKKRVRLFLDAENYRAKREETLIKLANKVAGEAVKNKRNVPLEPMNAYERHIIHEALSEHPNVFTYSTGAEPHRCTVVAVHGRKGTKSRKR